MRDFVSHQLSPSDRVKLRRWTQLALALVLAILVATMFAVRPPVIVWIAVLITAAIVAIIVARHARKTTYRCTSCGTSFSVSPVTDFASPHYPDKKLLTCPSCGRTEWCNEN